jgi:hypothetical protein
MRRAVPRSRRERQVANRRYVEIPIDFVLPTRNSEGLLWLSAATASPIAVSIERRTSLGSRVCSNAGSVASTVEDFVDCRCGDIGW